MLKVIGLGAGGHAKVIIEILNFRKEYSIYGLLDPIVEKHGQVVLGVRVLGNDNLLLALKEEGIKHFFVGVGSVGDTSIRKHLFERTINYGMIPIDAIHPKAIVSPSVEYSVGVTIMAGAIVNADAYLGKNVIINSGAIVEHDCVIDSHAHIATGARLSGGVHVGVGAHIGVGATVKQGVLVGDGAVVGAGAVVVKDVSPNVVVIGVPARPMHKSIIE